MEVVFASANQIGIIIIIIIYIFNFEIRMNKI